MHRPSIQDPSEENLCVDGKLLPRLYVLGAKNSGTSSLWSDLKSGGVWTAPANGKEKEWFFFKVLWQHTNATNEDAVRSLWLSSFLACPESGTLMGDFTVPNLFVVPVPPGFRHSAEFGFPAKHDSVALWDTAALLRRFYGGEARRVQFVIMLREEPLARMQSEYYHTRSLHNCMGCMANETFADSLDLSTALATRSPPEVTDWLWKSMYAR
eukprot:CAMPEP_0179350106 /NCGR_PEP_ID=MMETSP0797-20121207/74583_1 /TAXON_ID=47934 /ORGANISM="Dinophysis acuminata, Strain DAEP01" /LENGTH=211 /DNA_ID=CAMNT_0021065005 /DNA_START=102 /DNA_END=734 /DNA_ORIENTATION=-